MELPPPTIETSLLSPEHHEHVHQQSGLAFLRFDVEEAKLQMRIAIPMIVTNVSQYGIILVSLMFAGHLGELQLAGAALANSWALVTGYVLIIGMTGALETLCGQAYGAKEYLMLGIYLQASIIVTFVCATFIMTIWLFSESILVYIGQDADVSAMAAIYLRSLIPGLYAYATLQSLTRFFQTQSVVMPLTICSICTLILHFVLCYLFVHQTTLGFRGPALANSITLWFIVSCLILYMKLTRCCENTWSGFSLEAFRASGPFLNLGIQSAVMVCLEYWAFEILILVAGLLPDSEMNTSLVAICVSTESLAYMVTFGFSAAVSTRVSNEIGAGHEYKAKLAVILTLKFAVLLAAILAVLLLIGHNIWAAAYSNSWNIKKNFAAMTPLVATSIFFDGIQGVLSGVARGCGWQHLAARTNFVGFYVIGMPIAIFLAFEIKLHSEGLWIGLVCGISSQTCILIIITLIFTDWSKMIGMTGALETLCGQAYGAKEYLMLGIYLQASIIVTFVCATFIMTIWLFSEPILIFVGQDADVSAMAAIYLRSLIPGLYAYATLQSLTRFFQTQSVVMPLTLCSICTLILHFVLCYLSVHQTTVGFQGPALANSISLWFIVSCLMVYMKLTRCCKNTWGGFSLEAFTAAWPFLNLGIQSAVMVCLEYWAFEILILVAGLLSDSEINTSLIAICLSTQSLAYMVTYGFSAAVSTRVSNELGAGNEHKAKLAVTLTLKIAVLLAAILAVLLLFGHNIWVAAYSDSLNIKQKFAAITPLVATSIFFDAIQGVLSGVARGCGWQHLVAWTNLVGFYAIGTPISMFLAFKMKLHSKGLWTGLVCGISSQTCILVIITHFFTDWSKMVQDVEKRKSMGVQHNLINP